MKWKNIPVKRRSVWLGCLVGLLLGTGTGVAWVAASEAPAEKRTATLKEPVVNQLESVLRDESLAPQERIEMGLALLEQTESPSEPPAGSEDTVTKAPSGDPMGDWLAEPFLDLGSPWLASGSWASAAEVQRLRQLSYQMLSDLHNRLAQWRHNGPPGLLAEPGWNPSMEISEREDEYIYRFDLPGVGNSEVSVYTEGAV